MTVDIFQSRNKYHFVTERIENENEYPLQVFACGKSAKSGGMMSMPLAMAITWLENELWCKECRTAIAKTANTTPPTT